MRFKPGVANSDVQFSSSINSSEFEELSEEFISRLELDLIDMAQLHPALYYMLVMGLYLNQIDGNMPC